MFLLLGIDETLSTFKLPDSLVDQVKLLAK